MYFGSLHLCKPIREIERCSSSITHPFVQNRPGWYNTLYIFFQSYSFNSTSQIL